MAAVASSFSRSAHHAGFLTSFRDGFLASEQPLPSPFDRKRSFDAVFKLPASMLEKGCDSPAPSTPDLVAPDSPQSGIVDNADSCSDSDVSAPASPSFSRAREPQPASIVSDAELLLVHPGDDSSEILRAASLLLHMWSTARLPSAPTSPAAKRGKLNKSGDEEAYVPKASPAMVRRTKKHASKDVRIPNSCEVHKKRHLKCPMDCVERRKREALQAELDRQRASGVVDEDSGSDMEAFA